VDQVELGTTENLMYSKPNYDIINRMNYFLFTWEWCPDFVSFLLICGTVWTLTLVSITRIIVTISLWPQSSTYLQAISNLILPLFTIKRDIAIYEVWTLTGFKIAHVNYLPLHGFPSCNM